MLAALLPLHKFKHKESLPRKSILHLENMSPSTTRRLLKSILFHVVFEASLEKWVVSMSNWLRGFSIWLEGVKVYFDRSSIEKGVGGRLENRINDLFQRIKDILGGGGGGMGFII